MINANKELENLVHKLSPEERQRYAATTISAFISYIKKLYYSLGNKYIYRCDICYHIVKESDKSCWHCETPL